MEIVSVSVRLCINPLFHLVEVVGGALLVKSVNNMAVDMEAQEVLFELPVLSADR